MTWYRFWKKSGPNMSLDEEYKWYNDDDELDGFAEWMCEEWAKTVGGGFNTHYSYGYEEVEVPPKKELIEIIGMEGLEAGEHLIAYHKCKRDFEKYYGDGKDVKNNKNNKQRRSRKLKTQV